uniref:Tudor domain-containing protein n=1 Tax=Timema shepardi TaxID=629360 RepID=A0A7R9G331_TIMSH|nr:unnamed protein product [Timema shepardi]
MSSDLENGICLLANALVVLSSTAEDGEIERNMNLNKAIVPIMLGLTLSGVSAALVYLIFRKVATSNVEWSPSLGELTGPYMVVPSGITLGLRYEYCAGCPQKRVLLGEHPRLLGELNYLQLLYKPPTLASATQRLRWGWNRLGHRGESHWCFKESPNDEDLDEKYLAIKTSRPALIEVHIPKDCVGVIIGRGGSNIKSIQDQTNTKIYFKDELETDEFRVCAIRGTADSAQVAEFMIRDLILNQPLIETVEIKIPQRAVGRIIGKGGETIRSISRASNAKITVENISQTDDKAFMDRRVIIKGSVDQISLAKSMIEEKVEEDSEERRNIERSMASRSPRQHPNKQYLTSAAQEELKKEKSGHLERLEPTGRDGFMEVYVSAVEGPSQFWLQVYGPRAIELDHLEMQMTDYYKSEENRKLHAIKEISCVHEGSKRNIGPFLHPLAVMTPLLAMLHVEVVVSSVVSDHSSREKTVPHVGWPYVPTLGSIFSARNLGIQGCDAVVIRPVQIVDRRITTHCASLLSSLSNAGLYIQPGLWPALWAAQLLALTTFIMKCCPLLSSTLEEGQIVAAPFLYDNKWYRAEVAKVTLDDYNIEDSKVSLYYVDYGDSATRSKHEVCELRTDFLRLRFQAIECCLARVKPRVPAPKTSTKWVPRLCDLYITDTVFSPVIIAFGVRDVVQQVGNLLGLKSGPPAGILGILGAHVRLLRFLLGKIYKSLFPFARVKVSPTPRELPLVLSPVSSEIQAEMSLFLTSTLEHV